jgi:prepilin peptidase CpaA
VEYERPKQLDSESRWVVEVSSMSFVQVAIVLISALACVIDLRERRIPNWLTFGAALAGLVFQVSTDGAVGLQNAALGWIAGAAVFFVVFALGGLGAGDIKLLAALGAWVGPVDVLWLCAYTAIAGMALAIIVSLWVGYLPQALRNVWLLLTHWRVNGVRPLPELTIHRASGPKLAYGFAIFTGTMVSIWTS